MSKPLLSKLNNLFQTGELQCVVSNSLSVTQVLKYLGYSHKGQYLIIIRNYLTDKNIDFSHFTSNGKPSTKIDKICPVCNKHFTVTCNDRKNKTTCSYSCANSYFRSKENNPNWRGGIKYREKALSTFLNKCSICGFDNVKALEVHHIDKDRSNNSLDNLVILCANCHLLQHH